MIRGDPGHPGDHAQTLKVPGSCRIAHGRGTKNAVISIGRDIGIRIKATGKGAEGAGNDEDVGIDDLGD